MSYRLAVLRLRKARAVLGKGSGVTLNDPEGDSQPFIYTRRSCCTFYMPSVQLEPMWPVIETTSLPNETEVHI